MKKKIFTVALICLSVAANKVVAQSDISKLSLKQCIELALNNNLPVKQSELLVETAEVEFKQAKANLLPNLNGSFNYGFNQGRTVDPITNSYINQRLSSSNPGLSSQVTLFNGLRLQNIIRQNKYAYEATKMDWQQVKDNLTLNVIIAYLDVLRSGDVLNITKGQLEVTKKEAERMEILVNEGASGRYQLTDLKGRQADEELSIISLENSLHQAGLALSRLMNIDYKADMQLERNDTESVLINYSMSSADVFQSALENLALVKANHLKIKSSERGIKIAQAGFYPTITFNANMGSGYSSLARLFSPTNLTEITTGDYIVLNGNQNPVLRKQQNYSSEKISYTQQLDNNLGTFAGINIAIPIFNNFQMRNRVKLAKINLKNSELESDDTKLQLKQDIEQTWLTMNSAYNRYKVLLQQEKDYEESYKSAEIRFINGVTNTYEFLIAKNNLDRTRTSLLQVKYEYIFQTKLLDFYSGKQLW